jgi:hypothetical protein
MTVLTTCEGCGEGFICFDPLPVCFDCVKARHRAAVKRKCACGRKAVPLPEVGGRGRRFIPCRRCLGTIRQTN